ncbi:hypothetical protein O3P69_014744 [Scylla paramamosain]|uniref:Uncharacterized protein n=1 Tax=Scylla paramamosain TaxID=85552 RepID=A0AAW0U2C8_SCYPA
MRHDYKTRAELGRAWACWGLLGRAEVITGYALTSSPVLVLCWVKRSSESQHEGWREAPPTHRQSLLQCLHMEQEEAKEGEILGLLSASLSSYCTDISQSSRGEEEVKDDEAQQMMPMDINSRDEDLDIRLNVGEAVIYELQRLFNIPKERAVKMVQTNNFLLVSDKAILKALYFLKDHQVSPEQLQRIPWLMLQPADVLHQKFKKLLGPHLFLSLSDGLGFCYFSQQTIDKLQRKFIREVYYLAHRLQIPVPLVAEKVVKPKQVLAMDIKKINTTIDIFNKYGVPMESVLSDLWVFYHNLEVTEDRLRQAAEAGCPNPKPWICHASLPVFERYLTRLRARRQVLGEHGSLETYLSERLQCPRSHIRTKLDLMLDAGFTTEDVRGCLRVLQYSFKRTKSRIEEMKSLGHHRFPISVLFKQPKTYANIVRRIKRDKQKEEKLRRESEERREGGEGREGGG